MPRIGDAPRDVKTSWPATTEVKGPGQPVDAAAPAVDAPATPAISTEPARQVWAAGGAGRLRPVSAVLTELAALGLSSGERALMKGAGDEAARTGKSLASSLPPALLAKRDAVLELETEALGAALSMSKKDRSALDPLIDKIAAGVTASGVDGSARASLDRLITQVDGEEWKATSSVKFGLGDSLQRGQGVAADSEGNFYFSGNLSLSKVSPSLDQTIASRSLAIPEDLKKLGANHIGDITVAGGKIYASIEDGPAYAHPFIARFDAKTLQFEKSFPLPRELQQDGVPYVAVDLAAGRLYTSEYSNPTKLNVFDLADMQPLPAIDLSKSLHHVQGAEVRDGMLYATCDDEKKGIYKINLRTGTVMPVAELGAGERELEGIAVTLGPKGPQLHVTSIENKHGNIFKKLLSSRVQLTSFDLAKPSPREQLAKP